MIIKGNKGLSLILILIILVLILFSLFLVRTQFFKGLKIEKETTDKNDNIKTEGKEYNEKNPVIPEGFRALDTEEAKWGDEATYNNGLVITDGVNEFVWVPIVEDIVLPEEDTSIIIGNENDKKFDAIKENLVDAGCVEDLNNDSKIDERDFQIQLKRESNDIIDSINKYKGFYIGRYEMSLSPKGIAQSKKGEMSINADKKNSYSWYSLYKKAKTYNNDNKTVKSGMIWGQLYDLLLKWIGEDVTLLGQNSDRITGKEEKDKVKNIYDLLGNSFEWTIRAYNNEFREYRGGYYEYAQYFDEYEEEMRSMILNRVGIANPTEKDNTISTRLILYIK